MQDLVTVAYVAERLGVSRQTVRNMVRDGRLTPAARADGPLGAYLFDPADLNSRLTAEDAPAVTR